VAFVALSGGKFAPRKLRLGAEADGYFEVLDGLKENDRIVTSAQFLINSESSLRAAIQQMLETNMEESRATQDDRPQGNGSSRAMEQMPKITSSAPTPKSPQHEQTHSNMDDGAGETPAESSHHHQ